MSAFERTRRIAVAASFAAAMAAAGIASGQTADRVATMSAAQARQVAIDEIRMLVAVSRAGRQHGDAQCRAAAARAGDLAGAAIDAVVHADKARERELRAVGAEAVEQPAVQDSYPNFHSSRVSITVNQAVRVRSRHYIWALGGIRRRCGSVSPSRSRSSA